MPINNRRLFVQVLIYMPLLICNKVAVVTKIIVKSIICLYTQVIWLATALYMKLYTGFTSCTSVELNPGVYLV